MRTATCKLSRLASALHLVTLGTYGQVKLFINTEAFVAFKIKTLSQRNADAEFSVKPHSGTQIYHVK